ncbi:50S ribosomal protein L17 [Candidatus Parcubacteria bacterium]|nr:50S ribosomal protein L17 [Candidatus Parcubacteria bacterium]
MKHRKHGRKFGRPAEIRKALLKGLAVSLVLHGKIRTTAARAKEVRMFLEPFITKARRGPHQGTVRALRKSLPPETTRKLVRELGPRFASRAGGYTRIIRLPARRSDGAAQVIMELLS